LTKLRNSQTIVILGAFVLLVITAIAIGLGVGQFGLESARTLVILVVILGLGSFAGVLTMFIALLYEQGKVLQKGEIRSAIAVALTVFYITLLTLSLLPNSGLDFSGEFLNNFYLVYITVIAFYFGTRALEVLKSKQGTT